MSDTQLGSTLIEMLIGMILAAIGLSGIYLVTIHASQLRRVDAESNQALAACRQQLEIARSLPVASVPALHLTGFPIDCDDDSIPDCAAVPGDPDGLPGLITATLERSTGPNVVYRVNASATWKGIRGIRSVWLETLVSDRNAR